MMANALVMLFGSAVVMLVLFTDWFFRPTAPDCPCGGKVFRSTTLRTTGNVVQHVPCWRCHQCAAVIEAHSHGAMQRLTKWWKKDRSLRKPATP